MPGQTREEDIPIDIYFNKLLDWLVDRRHCDLKWQQAVLGIRERINVAMEDMPPNEEIRELLSGAYINYFHCKRIVELLKKSDEGGRNFFGQYSSKRIKDWNEIVSGYERNSLCLAESSQMLIQNVNYEIPSLKRQIGKCQQIQRDCVRKEGECGKNANTVREAYHQVCKQMSIKGENVKKELLELANDLPNLFKDISADVRTLTDGVDYYSAFVKFLSGCLEDGDTSLPPQTPLLCHVIKHGNTSVYQWRFGKVPAAVIEEPTRQITIDAESEGADAEIDWGIVSSSDTQTTDAIDFGDVDATKKIEDSGIDWAEDEVIDFGDNDVEIDYGIESSNTPIDIGVASTASSEGDVAIGSDALSILENTTTRNLFIDELMELQSFLEQRLDELSMDSDVLSIHQFQSAPSTIQMQSKATVLNMLKLVTSVIDNLTSMKMQHLYMIKSSPRYVDRLAVTLEQKSKLAEKMMKQRDVLVERREQANKTQSELEPKLSLIVLKTKELQINIANEISKKYKMRKVNIMGEINMI